MFAFWVNYSFNVIQFCNVICQDKKINKKYFVPSGLDFICHLLQNTISNALATAKAQQAPTIMWQSLLSSVIEGKQKQKHFWYGIQIKAFTILSNQHYCQLRIATAVVVTKPWVSVLICYWPYFGLTNLTIGSISISFGSESHASSSCNEVKIENPWDMKCVHWTIC